MTDPAARATDLESPVPPELLARWNESTERLFATAASQPEQYQRSTGAVGVLVGRLRERATGRAELLELWRDRDSLLDELGALLPAGTDPARCLEAAFAMHYPAAREADACRRRTLALEGTGEDWVVLEESGDADGSPFMPYRRLVARASSRTALLVSTRPDDQLAGCVHLVQELDIDPGTGCLGAGGDAEPATFASAAAREEYVAALQARRVGGG